MRDCLTVSGEWIFTYSDGTVVKEKNLITTSGLGGLAAIFVGEIPADNAIYIACGTGTTAAAAGDTKLETEGYRKLVSQKSRSGAVITLRTYLLQSEGNGTWTEWAVFLAGTGIADSGVMLNHLLSTKTKANNQALTVEVKLTLAAA